MVVFSVFPIINNNRMEERLTVIFEDLMSRFIVNVPESEIATVERCCFQVEQAHWFYEDFLRDNSATATSNTLPHYTLKAFAGEMFARCPLLEGFLAQHGSAAAIHERFMAYKANVPVCGAILLNPTLDKCLLVRGWTSKASWTFPKGKINDDTESDEHCAIREVYEETGVDLSAVLDSTQFIQLHLHGGEQRNRMYIVPNVDEATLFCPQTRKEIGDVKWHFITDIQQSTNTKGDTKYFMVQRFMPELRRWIKDYRRRTAHTMTSGTTGTPSTTATTATGKKKGRGRSQSASDPSSSQQQQHHHHHKHQSVLLSSSPNPPSILTPTLPPRPSSLYSKSESNTRKNSANELHSVSHSIKSILGITPSALTTHKDDAQPSSSAIHGFNPTTTATPSSTTTTTTTSKTSNTALLAAYPSHATESDTNKSLLLNLLLNKRSRSGEPAPTVLSPIDETHHSTALIGGPGLDKGSTRRRSRDDKSGLLSILKGMTTTGTTTTTATTAAAAGTTGSSGSSNSGTATVKQSEDKMGLLSILKGLGSTPTPPTTTAPTTTLNKDQQRQTTLLSFHQHHSSAMGHDDHHADPSASVLSSGGGGDGGNSEGLDLLRGHTHSSQRDGVRTTKTERETRTEREMGKEKKTKRNSHGTKKGGTGGSTTQRNSLRDTDGTEESVDDLSKGHRGGIDGDGSRKHGQVKILKRPSGLTSERPQSAPSPTVPSSTTVSDSTASISVTTNTTGKQQGSRKNSRKSTATRDSDTRRSISTSHTSTSHSRDTRNKKGGGEYGSVTIMMRQEKNTSDLTEGVNESGGGGDGKDGDAMDIDMVVEQGKGGGDVDDHVMMMEVDSLNNQLDTIVPAANENQDEDEDLNGDGDQVVAVGGEEVVVSNVGDVMKKFRSRRGY